MIEEIQEQMFPANVGLGRDKFDTCVEMRQISLRKRNLSPSHENKNKTHRSDEPY